MKFVEDFLKNIQIVAYENEEYISMLESLKMYNKKLDKNNSMKEGLIYNRSQLWIPNASNIWMLIVQDRDSEVARHFREQKTFQLILRKFFWPNLQKTVNDYIAGCQVYQSKKAIRQPKQRLLLPLELVFSLWTSISIDFITELLLS